MKQTEKKLWRGTSWVFVLLALSFAVALAICLKPQETREAAAPEPEATPTESPEPEPAAIPQAILDFVGAHPEAADFAAEYPCTVFRSGEIDLTGDYLPGDFPLLLQFDSRWGYACYGGEAVSDLMGLSGCGPTALSMAVVGLTGNTDWNPLAVAEYAAAHDYWTEHDGTKWLLISEGCWDMGLTAAEVPLDLGAMEAALEDGCIVCVVGPGDFTDKGHFLVLCGYDGSGFALRDPASRSNSERTWTYEQLSGQIQAMWALTAD